MRKLIVGFVLLLSAFAAQAQTTNIVANSIAYFGGGLVTGQFCVTPTDSGGNPINLTTPTGQQFSPLTPLCFPIVNGVLANPATVPDVSQTQPANACLRLTVNNTYNVTVATYPCLQPQGSTWSFDAYAPSSLPTIPALALPQFQTNGTPNPTQGVLNLAGSGVTYGAGGTVTIAGGSSAVGTVTAAMVTGGLDAFQVINSVASSLATGSIVDATQLGTATFTVTHQLTALNQSGKSIVLILSPGTRFQINTVFTSPTNTPASCAVPVGGVGTGTGSAIIVPGYNSLNGNFYLGSSAVVWDAICTGDFTGNQESMRLDGVHITGNASASVGGALMHIAGTFIPTRISNSGTYNCYAQCLEVDAGTTGSGGPAIGDVMFDDDNFQDAATTGTYPGSVVNINSLSSSGEATKVTFIGGAIQNNGPHNPLLTISGHGSVQNKAISFYDVDYETSAATPSGANPDVNPIQIADASEVLFSTLNIQGNINSTYQTRAVEISQSISNNSWGIDIERMVVYSGAGFACMVYNGVDSTCETGFNSGNGFLTLPNRVFGLIAPSMRLTNITPASADCVTGTLGTIWANSAATAGAGYICQLVSGTPTWVLFSGPSTGGGTSNENLTFSATPTFSTSTTSSRIALSGNITSFTLGSGTDGQQKCLTFAHDATTTAYTIVAPSNVKGLFSVGTAASKSSQQCFTYLTSSAAWTAQSAGAVDQ